MRLSQTSIYRRKLSQAPISPTVKLNKIAMDDANLNVANLTEANLEHVSLERVIANASAICPNET
ncbi:MAG: hypothetical protein HOI25_06635 [Proteobacteria bacterium]|nr:hypothetical protein [Pseudomonadota bacterium]